MAQQQKTTHTTMRAPQWWLSDMVRLSEDYGLSRQAAIIMAAGVGMRVLRNVTLTTEQMAKLMEGE